MAKSFITFDPGDVDEKNLADKAVRAAREGLHALDLTVNGAPMHIKVREILDIAGDIDGQIYARDFILVRQADMIVSYIPELPNPAGGPGKPGLSSGVERELQHAHEHAKDVFVIWKPKKEPSPFITQTANKVFPSVEEALRYFESQGLPHSARPLRLVNAAALACTTTGGAFAWWMNPPYGIRRISIRGTVVRGCREQVGLRAAGMRAVPPPGHVRRRHYHRRHHLR